MATDEEIRRVAAVIEKADTEIIQCDYDDMARAAISEMEVIEREKQDALMSRLEVRGISVQPELKVTIGPSGT